MKIRATDNQLEIATPAKVNLFLELLGRRDDGFHEIETVMSAVSIYDYLRFAPRQDIQTNLTIDYASCGNQPRELDDIPCDQRNLICKSVELMRKIATDQGEGANCCGLDIHLLKNIPSAAGLGGASSNSAAALVAANRIWKLNWTTPKLAEVAAQLGSDIAFFLTGGTAMCRGRGEKIEPIASPARLSIVVAKPAASLSTAKVFSNVKLESKTIECSTFNQSVQAGCAQSIGSHLFNRLQEFATPLTDQIAHLRTEFDRLSCYGHQMSGSGSSYFGIFANAKHARLAANRLSSRLHNVRIFCSHTLGRT